MDWKRLITDLAAAGMNQAQIAAACGVSQPTVSDLARIDGRQPGFEFGTKLVALHKSKVKRDRRETAKSFESPSWMKPNGGDRRKSPIVVHPDRRAGPSDRRERSR